MAEGVGFEPTMRYSRIPVFETGAFNRSATPPKGLQAGVGPRLTPALSPLASHAKELAEQGPALLGTDAANHLDAVVEPRVLHHVLKAATHPGFGIGSPVD